MGCTNLFSPFRTNRRSTSNSGNPTPMDPREYPLRLRVLLEPYEADTTRSAVWFEENFEIRQKWRLGRTAGEVRAQEGQREGRREPREEQSSRFSRRHRRFEQKNAKAIFFHNNRKTESELNLTMQSIAVELQRCSRCVHTR